MLFSKLSQTNKPKGRKQGNIANSTTAKTEKPVTNVANSAASLQFEMRNFSAGKLFGKSYDDLTAEQKKAVRDNLKGAGKKDAKEKSTGKKSCYAYSIGTEPLAKHISVLLKPSHYIYLGKAADEADRAVNDVIRDFCEMLGKGTIKLRKAEDLPEYVATKSETLGRFTAQELEFYWTNETDEQKADLTKAS